MKIFTTEHIMAEVHKNPYEPGCEVHIDASYATREEIEQLRDWLNAYLGNVLYTCGKAKG